jgi:hypothetical protein
MAPEVQICVLLDMEQRDINHVPSDIFQRKIQAFKTHLIQDIVNAIDGHKDHIRIEKIEPGSILVTMAMETGVCGDHQTPIEAARSLKQQAADPKSKLMNGVFTRKTKSVSILSEMVEVSVDPLNQPRVSARTDSLISLPRPASCSSEFSMQTPRSGSPGPLPAPTTPSLPPHHGRISSPLQHQEGAENHNSVFAHGLLPPQFQSSSTASNSAAG